MTLINRMITANLEQAHEYAVHDNREGFERHCAHAERLAERHAPGRITDVEQVLAADPGLLGDPPEVEHSELPRSEAEIHSNG